MNPTAKAALDYTRAGFALVPIPTGTKGPRTPNWQTRQAAITSPDQASKLTAGIGLAHRWCGTCALDVDDAERADTWLRANGIELAEILAAPDAVQIVSGKPNRAKLLYRLPPGVESLPTLKEADDALEFRCASRDGSSTLQDVLPPSVHPDTGKPYQWGGAGDWRALPTLPDALLKLWQSLALPMLPNAANTPASKQRTPEHSARPNAKASGNITEGGRNDSLASLAGTMRRKGMESASIEAALLAENRSRCNPPLPDDEVRTIARSVSRYPSNAEQGTPADAEPITWAKPQPLPEGLPDVPRFDADLLPDALRPWLLDIANRMQCPLDYPAVGAMVALGAVVGQRLRIRPKRQDNWQEAPNLWGGIIGRPGAMKSPALGEALKPLKAIEGRALEKAKADAAKHAIEAMELKAREKALTSELESVFRPVKAKAPKPNKADPDTTALPFDGDEE